MEQESGAPRPERDAEDAVSLAMFSAYGQAMSWFDSAVKALPILSIY
jgi:hypothetical protein